MTGPGDPSDAMEAVRAFKANQPKAKSPDDSIGVNASKKHGRSESSTTEVQNSDSSATANQAQVIEAQESKPTSTMNKDVAEKSPESGPMNTGKETASTTNEDLQNDSKQKRALDEDHDEYCNCGKRIKTEDRHPIRLPLKAMATVLVAVDLELERRTKMYERFRQVKELRSDLIILKENSKIQAENLKRLKKNHKFIEQNIEILKRDVASEQTVLHTQIDLLCKRVEILKKNEKIDAENLRAFQITNDSIKSNIKTLDEDIANEQMASGMQLCLLHKQLSMIKRSYQSTEFLIPIVERLDKLDLAMDQLFDDQK